MEEVGSNVGNYTAFLWEAQIPTAELDLSWLAPDPTL